MLELAHKPGKTNPSSDPSSVFNGGGASRGGRARRMMILGSSEKSL
jgi:hypothetical protein